MSDYFVGNVNEVHLTGLYLEGGQTYRIVIQGCHAVGCYNVCVFIFKIQFQIKFIIIKIFLTVP